ncbi:nitroreductase family protein [Frateuria sp. YIM B11624]|uniref:nitroreductase family protein n=1 Tax=Frateuria sp. YIM B11624 TaxID=3143185 RepID=UPI003C711EF9
MSWDSTWRGLGQPRPLLEPSIYDEHVWSLQTARPLPLPVVDSALLNTLRGRRSARQFGRLSEEDLAALLWSVAACKESVDSPMGFPLERRGVPSAGAIHPIHILVCDSYSRTLSRYDGLSHTLQRLDVLAPVDLLAMLGEILPMQDGTLLLFVAEPGKTDAKYADPVSLVLRDAGVLQGAMAIAAEALGLNFCLLGATGDPWIAALSDEGKLRGVGAALVGSRT